MEDYQRAKRYGMPNKSEDTGLKCKKKDDAEGLQSRKPKWKKK